jgi:hypothetical protein
MKTQKQEVLAYLKKHKNITSWEAIQEFHITRLAAVIFALKEEGYLIAMQRMTDIETGKNWAKYIYMGRK